MADTVGHPGVGQVGQEGVVVGLALVGAAVDLLRAAVVAGVGVDRHHLDAVGGGAAEHDGGAALVAADLDDRGAGASSDARARSRRAWASVIQPWTSLTASRAASGEAGACVCCGACSAAEGFCEGSGMGAWASGAGGGRTLRAAGAAVLLAGLAPGHTLSRVRLPVLGRAVEGRRADRHAFLGANYETSTRPCTSCRS